MLNSIGESGHPCLFPDFRENVFSFSPLRILFAVGFSYMAFILLSHVPSAPSFWGVLSKTDIEFCQGFSLHLK